MRTRWAIQAALVGVILALGACDSSDSDPSGPIVTSSEGIRFVSGSTTYKAEGTLSAANASGLLQQEFAVAREDSLGGVVVVGYDASGNSGNLFIIQAPEQAATFSCASTSSCHGRYITNVPTSGDTSAADRFFEITNGSLTITSLSGGRLKGTFSGTLTANDGQGNSTMTVTNGTIDVPFLPDGATDGSLGCLLSKVGVGSGSCS